MRQRASRRNAPKSREPAKHTRFLHRARRRVRSCRCFRTGRREWPRRSVPLSRVARTGRSTPKTRPAWLRASGHTTRIRAQYPLWPVRCAGSRVDAGIRRRSGGRIFAIFLDNPFWATRILQHATRGGGQDTFSRNRTPEGRMLADIAGRPAQQPQSRMPVSAAYPAAPSFLHVTRRHLPGWRWPAEVSVCPGGIPTPDQGRATARGCHLLPNWGLPARRRWPINHGRV